MDASSYLDLITVKFACDHSKNSITVLITANFSLIELRVRTRVMHNPVPVIYQSVYATQIYKLDAFRYFELQIMFTITIGCSMLSIHISIYLFRATETS